jgi:hypothetical protein
MDTQERLITPSNESRFGPQIRDAARVLMLWLLRKEQLGYDLSNLEAIDNGSELLIKVLPAGTN